MGKAELAQLIDREELDASPGARGRLSLAIPAAWAQGGGEIEIAVPARVCCARCDGGGCDGCGRSGALRTPSEPAARTLRLRLPAELSGGVTLRLVRPFGEQAPLDQLLVELRAEGAPSPGVTRVAPPPALALVRPTRLSKLSTPAIATIVAVLAAVVGLLASR